MGWAPAGERSRMESRRWASSTPQPQESGVEIHVPLPSGPRWTIASFIRFSAARLRPSSRPMIPAMPHIVDSSRKRDIDYEGCTDCEAVTPSAPYRGLRGCAYCHVGNLIIPLLQIPLDN